MKLRCTENSIRLRLRKSDITTLAEERVIGFPINFPSGACLKYEIRINTGQEIVATFDNSLISIQLPESTAFEWINSTQVGISKELNLSNDSTLAILIEKDFPCKDRPEEDKADTFQELVPEEKEGDVC